jgi:hypothetical protein
MNSNTKAYVNIIKQVERYHTMKRDLDDHISKVKSNKFKNNKFLKEAIKRKNKCLTHIKNQCQENMKKNKTSFSFKVDDNMQISKYQHDFFI